MPAYDEFGLFHENASEAGLPFDGPPAVVRREVEVAKGRVVSALVWGAGPPEWVLLHGGGQNAHTWDTVALALGRPLVAIDLPGHGHSGWREAHDYAPPSLADDVAVAMRALAPDAGVLVGMSLGGLTAACVAAQHPALVRKLVLVDVTPGTDHGKARAIVDFLSGPEVFASFDEILERTVRFNPTRRLASLRRGVLHNAREKSDGTWTWRYDPVREWKMAGGASPDFASLWEAIDRVRVPLLLVRGGVSPVVGDEDVAELQRRQTGARVVTVEGAGHSVQGDRPRELAALFDEFAGAGK